MMSKQNSANKLERNSAKRSPAMTALLCCLFALCLGGKAAAQTAYPTSNGHVMRVSFRHYSANPSCSASVTENCVPQTDLWQLSSNSWIGVTYTDLGSPPEAELPDATVEFPIEISYGHFVGQLPQTTRNRIHLDATLVLRPHYDSTGSLSQTATASTTLGNSGSSLVLSTPFYWLDEDVTLQVAVWYDVPNRRISTYTLPITLRARKSLFNLLSPYMTPVAIIGRPPGDQSWSRLTVTSGAGVGLAIWRGTSNSTTTEESYGYGPYQHQEPEHTEIRVSNRGIQQNLIFNTGLNFSTSGPGSPGEGDVMICLLRPTFAVYSAARDLDFRYLQPSSGCEGAPTQSQGAPTTCNNTTPASQGAIEFVHFPMRELLNPFVAGPLANLTASENAAFRALDPLLGDPHAILSEPRYYHILNDNGYPGSCAGGNYQTKIIHRDTVERIMLNSTSYTRTNSVTIPVGAITQAAGLPLPIPDFQYRYTETTTASTEIRTMKTLEGSSGNLVEYQLCDSRRYMHAGIYYDTYFRTFVFRESPPARQGFMARIREENGIEKIELKEWKAYRYEDAKGEAPVFFVIGSLKKFGIEKGSVEFRPLDKSKPNHRATVLPGTGNVMLADLVPGDYQIIINKTVRLLRVSKEGYVTFE